jgi:hypothetical protein
MYSTVFGKYETIGEIKQAMEIPLKKVKNNSAQVQITIGKNSFR